jgi:hypothetical protein
VDAKGDARLKQAHRAWLSKGKEPNPPIFWEFIYHDRNVLLKMAELTVEHSVALFLSGGTIPRHASQPPPPPPPIYTYQTIYTYQMSSGCFAGQDTRNLVSDAIKWWEEQLDDIEQKAAVSSP